VVFGWVFAAHMVGAGFSALAAGVVREATGSYDWAWWSAGALCLMAAVASYVVPRGDVLRAEAPAPEPSLAPR
jgi:hypothetical protein